jgi:glutaconate CoA-transferase subunit A
MPMREAVARFVPDGATVALGTCLEPAIPFAAGHELIRQGRRDLTLVGPISDALFDQLIGAGCVARVVAAWVGNVSEGLGHAYRRAAEKGEPRPIEIHDHSNFSIALALWAAAWNAPFIPTRTLLGSDIPRGNPGLQVEDGWVRVLPVKPDVTILHVQRADAAGRAHAWGPLGISEEAGLAAERVILCCEDLVGADVTLSDPNRILLPETKVVKALQTMNALVMVEPGRVPGEHNVFLCGDDDTAKATVAEILRSFGWPDRSIVDLGPISAARGTEMYLALWVRLYGALGTGDFNIGVAQR